MYPKILNFIQQLENEFQSIPENRKKTLALIANYITEKQLDKKHIQLLYVCTHNSRRSHLGQIWARVAADYYKINNVRTFSGGTEVTRFNINALHALQRIGFLINKKTDTENPVFEISHSESNLPCNCFSKLFFDKNNPPQEFAAIMTCSEAEENCPLIYGAELKIATTYDDPKIFDDTPLQNQKYNERCKQIALETFFVFSQVKNNCIL